MANTWRATSQAVTYAATKHMLDVFNAAASSRYIRIYRIFSFNNGTAAATGALGNLQIRRITTSVSGGTTVTPVAHSSAYSALNANTTAGTGRTTTLGSLYRQILWQNDEPTVTTLDMDAMLTLVPFAEVWNSGYGDSNIEPLTMNSGTAEGFSLYCPSLATATATLDAEIEFTDASA